MFGGRRRSLAEVAILMGPGGGAGATHATPLRQEMTLILEQKRRRVDRDIVT
jgi:hypothetical protein